MIKTYLFLTAPRGVDPFASRGETAADVIRRALPRIAGYAQTRALAEQLEPGVEPAFAGVAELWFVDSADALAAAADHAALTHLFTAGVAVAAVVVGSEHIVMRLPDHRGGSCIKGVFPFRRKRGMTVADFQRYWLQEHGPLAARTQDALCYLQCHPLPATYDGGAPVFDGITELHWPSIASARSAMGSRQMQEEQVADSRIFAEPGSVMLFLAEEEPVIPA
jgi:uncharacterized protein (TIGR02118 family)